MKRLVATLLIVGGTYTQAAFGDQKTDDRIYDQVRMKLTTDQDVKGGGFEVTVKDGVVTIKGRADTERGRDRATKLAKKVKGVKQVDNQLQVGPPTQ